MNYIIVHDADTQSTISININHIEEIAKRNGGSLIVTESGIRIKAKVAEKIGNPKLQGAWIANDKQYVGDGYRVIVNRTPLALKELVLESPNDKPLDVQSMIDHVNFVGEIPLPTLAEIESEIKRCKAEAKARKIKDARIMYTIKCHDIYWTCNAEYLRDGILATGATCAKVGEKNTFPILLCGTDADYLLCPVNTKVEHVGAYIA